MVNYFKNDDGCSLFEKRNLFKAFWYTKQINKNDLIFRIWHGHEFSGLENVPVSGNDQAERHDF